MLPMLFVAAVRGLVSHAFLFETDSDKNEMTGVQSYAGSVSVLEWQNSI